MKRDETHGMTDAELEDYWSLQRPADIVAFVSVYCQPGVTVEEFERALASIGYRRVDPAR